MGVVCVLCLVGVVYWQLSCQWALSYTVSPTYGSSLFYPSACFEGRACRSSHAAVRLLRPWGLAGQPPTPCTNLRTHGPSLALLLLPQPSLKQNRLPPPVAPRPESTMNRATRDLSQLEIKGIVFADACSVECFAACLCAPRVPHEPAVLDCCGLYVSSLANLSGLVSAIRQDVHLSSRPSSHWHIVCLGTTAQLLRGVFFRQCLIRIAAVH